MLRMASGKIVLYLEISLYVFVTFCSLRTKENGIENIREPIFVEYFNLI